MANQRILTFGCAARDECGQAVVNLNTTIAINPNMSPVSILWFRSDLRLADNPALEAALKRGGQVVPVFIWAPEEDGEWPPGAASKWWLHRSLEALAENLGKLGSPLVLRHGPTLDSLRTLAKETGATAVFWNRRYEPAIIARDARLKASLRAAGLEAESFNAALLHEPWTVQNQSGKPFQIFTAYWRHCLTKPDPAPLLRPPELLTGPSRRPKSLALVELDLQPEVQWDSGLRGAWRPGEANAAHQLHLFLSKAFDHYSTRRDRPDATGTSRLSPHLHFGEISPRQIWHALRCMAKRRKLPSPRWRGSQFLAELGWREFAHHLLYHFPCTPTEPLRPEFTHFRWRKDPSWLRAWQRGRTGYPLVDAGMRELWATGWMHNRVRMVTASFLVKDLLLSWQEGARWFWDTLVDADLAQNTLGWQWTAGCGADAAPYFRIFNPVTQGEKFDPDGDYVRRWCPELAGLPAKYIQAPHRAPAEALASARIELGKTYPEPIVSHAIAREVALEAFERIKANRGLC
jgi:deoxyribodipyrimidine photo-lyase